MKAEFETRAWLEAKPKLLQSFDCLTENDFNYENGEENRMLERIRTKVKMA